MLKIPQRNFIWVIGSPRSGTTMLTDFIGKYTDKVYNEPWESHPVDQIDKWKFPNVQSITFKYCSNWKNASKILSKFRNSKFVHIIRNPADVVFSIMFPKKDSYPPRSWENFGKKREKRFSHAVNLWYNFLIGSLQLPKKANCKIVVYEHLPSQIDDLGQFLNLPLKNLNFNYKNVQNTESLEDLWALYPKHLAKRREIEEQWKTTNLFK